MIYYYEKGWEKSFEKLIGSIRENELDVVRKCCVFISLLNFNYMFLTYAITIGSLATFLYYDKNNVLDPTIAYVCLALLNTLKLPLFLIGLAFSLVINVTVFYLENEKIF